MALPPTGFPQTPPFQPLFNYPNNKLYQYEAYPILLSCNFVVDNTNPNGLGIRSLKGNGIANVFMNTTPASFSASSVFASGATVITMSDTSNVYLGQAVTDSTTGANITAGTLVSSVNYIKNQVTLSKPTAGASASSPGDTLVFQYTTAGIGNYGYANPNPQAGMIVVQFQNQFNRYLSGWSGFVSPLNGTSVVVGTTTLTAGDAYVIVSLGNTTTPQWQTLGMPAGETPAVGLAFIASGASHTGLGTGAVQKPATSGITSIEVVGDPNASLQNSNLYQNGGAQMVLQCLAPTSTSVTTLTPTAPAYNTVIGLNFYLSNSSVSVNGQ